MPRKSDPAAVTGTWPEVFLVQPEHPALLAASRYENERNRHLVQLDGVSDPACSAPVSLSVCFKKSSSSTGDSKRVKRDADRDVQFFALSAEVRTAGDVIDHSGAEAELIERGEHLGGNAGADQEFARFLLGPLSRTRVTGPGCTANTTLHSAGRESESAGLRTADSHGRPTIPAVCGSSSFGFDPRL